MSLPPGFLDELRTRVSLSTIVGRKVAWDMRRSNQGRGDMWAPCPFHQEKSASFHVDDKKGFYYCFGCHAKGDAVTFVKETENVGFLEAVERLAREAGMTMPARDPQAARQADRRTQLSDLVEEAVQHFRLTLRTAAAAPAREYLARRGLTPDAQERWGIGFAPDARQGLFAALTGKGHDGGLLVDAGLCARPDDGGAPYDRFRGRIIFPIRDARGRAISLGGRAMDPNARAKYLNGPETEIFDKGRTLFNHAPAREAAGKGQPLVVAEGYMDVIALSEAGFKAAVAPLGTAVTEEQLRLLWRIHAEPVMALDGDTAGVKAALRVMDLALPLLEAGQGLRFAMLPTGMDPDDLIRAQGAPAMRAVLDKAQPMVALLWQRETEGRVFDSPERKATLDKTLSQALARIADPSIRSHYAEEIKSLRWALFGQRNARNGVRRKDAPAPLRSVTRTSLIVTASPGSFDALREASILATLITHPDLVPRFLSALERVEVTGDDHAILRRLIVRHAGDPPALRGVLQREATEALERLFAHAHVCISPPVRNPDDTQSAMLCLAEELAKLDAHRGARREIEDAVEDLSGLADEGVTWRLLQAARARHKAEKPDRDDATDLGEDRAALSRHLQSLIDNRIWVKKPEH